MLSQPILLLLPYPHSLLTAVAVVLVSTTSLQMLTTSVLNLGTYVSRT